MSKNVVWFSEVDKDDIPLVGGKGANLGEMTKAGFPVPPGFIITAQAYYRFLKENRLDKKIPHLVNTINFDNPHSLRQVSLLIKKEIMEGEISDELKLEIYSFYKKLGGILEDPLVAVRSSATAEDLPNASFAGQQETFLNVKGESNLILKIKQCFASLFTERAIFYRHENKFDHVRVGIAIPIQKMVGSDTSGVMFTIDPVTSDRSKLIIEAVYGLGEMIVQGIVTPDHFEVSRKTGDILSKQISEQQKMLKKVGDRNKEVGVTFLKRKKQKITDSQIKELLKLGVELEKHYYFPQDIEWAIEGSKIYIVQTRPITTITKKPEAITKKPEASFGKLLLKGDSASPGIATGHVRIIKSTSQISSILPQEILVAAQTNPDFVPAMKKASAIVTNFGGKTSHAAIVSRELGIPAVVGTQKATSTLKNGDVITVNGSSGEIFEGGNLSLSTNEILNEGVNLKTATKVYINLAEPELAQRHSKSIAQGVGLLRAEFMIAGIGTHPKKMIRDGRRKQFISELSDRLEQFCYAFNPRPVVYRATDFKTNEYRNLAGGKEYEPVEPNPMLGFRGAFRYIHDPRVFELELEAIKEVREKKGYKNLWLMIPFVRTPKELSEVKRIVSSSGLTRSVTFKIWMMVEIPSNVILLEDFIKIGIDGVSIGTNDLTMLILGTDRDNSEVAHVFDERNPAVLWAIEKVIKTSQKYGITSSICGQAASYPEILDIAIKAGVTSVSVSPDAVGKTKTLIAKLEEKFLKKQ